MTQTTTRRMGTRTRSARGPKSRPHSVKFYSSQVLHHDRLLTTNPCSKCLEVEVRRSSRNGRGTGGRMIQMQNLERLQVGPGKRKSRRLTALDDSTKNLEVNPMAPTSSTELQPNSRPRPRPRLKSKQIDSQGAPASRPSSESPPVRPSFTLAAPGQQFGFRMPDSQGHSPALSNSSLPHSSHASTVFSGAGVSRTSTAPTSRTPSVCYSSHSVEEDPSRRRSSHLLKLASQSGIEAPTRVSRAVIPSYVQHPSHQTNPRVGEADLFVSGGESFLPRNLQKRFHFGLQNGMEDSQRPTLLRPQRVSPLLPCCLTS